MSALGAVLCMLSTLCCLACMMPAAWPARRPLGIMCYGLSFFLPFAAHTSITKYHAALRRAWIDAVRAHHADESVPLPSELDADAHHVVALVAGLVWALPVAQFVSETTQEWALPQTTPTPGR